MMSNLKSPTATSRARDPAGAALYSAIADGYDDSYAVPSHRRVYDRLAWEHVSALPLPRAAHIVDVGCGTGRWIPAWLARGHHVTGIEQAPGMIDVLRRRNLGSGFSLIETPMENAFLPSQSADLVLAMGSVQYAADPADMIRRFASWTRPGGIVCVYVDSLMALILELVRNGQTDKALEMLSTRRGVFRTGHHAATLTLYDTRLLERHFADAGLVDARCYGLAVGASAAGRAGCTAAMVADEDAAMNVERALSAEALLADAGLHILAIGRKPLPA